MLKATAILQKAFFTSLQALPAIAMYIAFFPGYTSIVKRYGTGQAFFIACILPIILAAITCALHFIKRGSKLMLLASLIMQAFISYTLITIWIKFFSKTISNKGLLPAILSLQANHQLQLGITTLNIACCCLLLRYTIVNIRSSGRFKKKGLKSDNFGNAKFASIKQLRQLNSQHGIPLGAMPKSLCGKNAIEIVNNMHKQQQGKILRLNFVHAFLIGQTGWGKGAGFIVPILLDYTGPVFVLDAKSGENHAITARRRAEMGRKVCLLDPYNHCIGDRYGFNPLEHIRLSEMHLIEDASDLARVLCPASENDDSVSKHFNEGAGAFLHAIIVYVLISPNFPKPKNLVTVYELCCQPWVELKEIFEELQNSDLANGFLAEKANIILSWEKTKERPGKLSTLHRELNFIGSPMMKKFLSDNSINMQQIINGNMDVFVCIPLDKSERLARLSRLITTEMFKTIEKKQGMRSQQNLLMILDEMPSMGYLPFVDKGLEYGRGYGVSIIGLSVTLEKLRAAYPNSWQTLISADLVVYFSFTEKAINKYLSEELGTITVIAKSANENAGSHRKEFQIWGSTSSSQAQTTSEVSRPMLFANELRMLPRETVIAIYQNHPPILCHRISYWKRKEWQGVWDANPLLDRMDEAEMEVLDNGEEKEDNQVADKIEEEIASET